MITGIAIVRGSRAAIADGDNIIFAQIIAKARCFTTVLVTFKLNHPGGRRGRRRRCPWPTVWDTVGTGIGSASGNRGAGGANAGRMGIVLPRRASAAIRIGSTGSRPAASYYRAGVSYAGSMWIAL